MSENYRVKVLSKDAATVELEITLLHPDAGGFPDVPNFGFQMLYVESEGPRTLEDEISKLGGGPGFLEEEFVLEYTDRFVASCELVEMRGFVPPKQPDAEWGDIIDHENPPIATYRITTTEPRWIDHLNVGDVWENACYDKAPNAIEREYAQLKKLRNLEE